MISAAYSVGRRTCFALPVRLPGPAFSFLCLVCVSLSFSRQRLQQTNGTGVSGAYFPLVTTPSPHLTHADGAPPPQTNCCFLLFAYFPYQIAGSPSVSMLGLLLLLPLSLACACLFFFGAFSFEPAPLSPLEFIINCGRPPLPSTVCVCVQLCVRCAYVHVCEHAPVDHKRASLFLAAPCIAKLVRGAPSKTRTCHTHTPFMAVYPSPIGDKGVAVPLGLFEAMLTAPFTAHHRPCCCCSLLALF